MSASNTKDGSRTSEEHDAGRSPWPHVSGRNQLSRFLPAPLDRGISQGSSFQCEFSELRGRPGLGARLRRFWRDHHGIHRSIAGEPSPTCLITADLRRARFAADSDANLAHRPQINAVAPDGAAWPKVEM